MKAAQEVQEQSVKTAEKAVAVGEASQAMIAGAAGNVGELLEAYRSAFVSADEIFRKKASRVESEAALDEMVLAWEKKRVGA